MCDLRRAALYSGSSWTIVSQLHWVKAICCTTMKQSLIRNAPYRDDWLANSISNDVMVAGPNHHLYFLQCYVFVCVCVTLDAVGWWGWVRISATQCRRQNRVILSLQYPGPQMYCLEARSWIGVRGMCVCVSDEIVWDDDQTTDSAVQQITVYWRDTGPPEINCLIVILESNPLRMFDR